MGEKSKQLLWNGHVIGENQFPDGLNRAFRFGDGLFESIRITAKRTPFLKYHFNRLDKGMGVLYLEKGSTFFSDIEASILKMLKQENIQNGICRLWVYRSGGGKYTPETNQASYFLQIEQLPGTDSFKLNKKGLSIEISDSVRLVKSDTSAFKTLNALPYVRASIENTQRKYDDLILLDDKERVAETTSSNIFLVKKRTIYTPTLDSGCINGVARQILIDHFKNQSIKLEEHEIYLEDLFKADELYLANSIMGIRWVSAFRKKRYFHHQSTYLSSILKSL